MDQIKPTLSPFRLLGLQVSAFGHLATAVVRALLRLERTGAARAAAKQAALAELWIWWALSQLTHELARMDAAAGPRTPEEEKDRAETACLLSLLFSLIAVVRGIARRCASAGGRAQIPAARPQPMGALARALRALRPAEHARAAWYPSARF